MEIIPVEKCFCEGGLQFKELKECVWCKQWNMIFNASVDNPYEWNKSMKLYTAMLEERRGNNSLKPKHHIGNGKPSGIFAGTLTMSPNDPYNQADMIQAIRKIMRQKSQPIKRYCWYLEYTKADVPHIHFIYETNTGGRITAQTFKRHWKIWDEHEPVGQGHRGGYHKHCHDENSYMDYIMKDNNTHSENRWTN